MSFASKLGELMKSLDMSQTKLSEMTGIGKSSISQYLSGRNEPARERKRDIARALGVQDDYFDEFLPVPEVQTDEVLNVPVPLAARLMRKSQDWIKQGLRDGVFPWGYAVKLKKWNYFISSVKFTEYTGIKVPISTEEG